MNFAKLYDQLESMSDQQREEVYQELLNACGLSEEIKEVIDAQFRQNPSPKTRLAALIFFAGMPAIPRYVPRT